VRRDPPALAGVCSSHPRSDRSRVSRQNKAAELSLRELKSAGPGLTADGDDTIAC
jgi:hypothetical protein